MRLEQDFVSAASDLVTLLRDEIAPRSWWPVLLCDSVEFLQYGKWRFTVTCRYLMPELVPKLLFSSADAIELLRKLEEITIRSSQGSGEDYLMVLIRTIRGGGMKDALERLKTVRLAIARYLARCTVGGWCSMFSMFLYFAFRYRVPLCASGLSFGTITVLTSTPLSTCKQRGSGRHARAICLYVKTTS